MSLAARCPACGTAFRVVQDQLRVSDGWVRCGRCSEVFDANETLFDLQRAAAPVGTPPVAMAAESPVTAHAGIAAAAATPPDATAAAWNGHEPAATPAVDVDALHTALFARPGPGRGDDDTAGTVATTLRADACGDVGVAEAEPGSMHPRGEPVPTPAVAEAAGLPTGNTGTPPATTDEAGAAPGPAATLTAPSFVREAERAARWRSPQMRALLASAAVVLAGAAALQTTLGFHEPIAARWPAARSWLEPLCRLAGCGLAPLRRLESLAVDGSSLVQVHDSALVRLTLALRSRDRSELLLPAIELTLTDHQGAVLARKVMSAAELGARGDTIAAGAELPLQAVLDTGGQHVVGYTIELFYP